MTDFLFLLALYADRLAIAGGEDGGVEFNKAIGITVAHLGADAGGSGVVGTCLGKENGIVAEGVGVR